MKVGHVTERTGETQGTSLLDSDEMDRAGIDLGATGRLQLMAKLAEGECSAMIYRLNINVVYVILPGMCVLCVLFVKIWHCLFVTWV